MNFEAALKFVAPLTDPRAGYCNMSADYDCNCSKCSALTRAHWFIGAFIWSIATAAARAEVETALGGLKGLATMGWAIEAALAPGQTLRALALWAGDAWGSSNGDLKGSYFRVVGKRGNAAKHVGKVGMVKWVGESDGGPRWAPRAHSIRLGLQIEGEAKLVYVTHAQCERLPTPPEVKMARLETKIVSEAIATLRPKWEGTVPKKSSKESRAKWLGRCPIAYIISGREAGKVGSVFWVGADKKTGEMTRLGIECKDIVWVSAYDCANTLMAEVPASERVQIERVAADAAMEGNMDAARALLGQTRRPLAFPLQASADDGPSYTDTFTE